MATPILKPKRLNKKSLTIFVGGFIVVGACALISIFALNPNLAGDINDDNVVNITDISNILKNYGGTTSSADANQDGAVNISDISVVLANYGKTYTPPPTGSPLPNGITGTWTLKFNEEFTGTTLNKSIWAPGWFGNGISGPVNEYEKACYSSSNLTMPGDGSLHMQLKNQQNTCKSTWPNTGSLVSTNPSDYVSGHTGYQYAYGVVEWRVYLPPNSSGNIANWPGTWSNGQNWPTDGENDTMEGLGGSACYHFHSNAGGPGGCASGSFAGWHTFASNWQPGIVKYYYDGVYVGQITTGITGSPQYLIMQNTTDLATAIPTDMLVDYVRVWQ
jgi:hypothetical protein